MLLFLVYLYFCILLFQSLRLMPPTRGRRYMLQVAGARYQVSGSRHLDSRIQVAGSHYPDIMGQDPGPRLSGSRIESGWPTSRSRIQASRTQAPRIKAPGTQTLKALKINVLLTKTNKLFHIKGLKNQCFVNKNK